MANELVVCHLLASIEALRSRNDRRRRVGRETRMKNSKQIALVATLMLGISSHGVSAQNNLRDFELTGRNDVRATASITIPLGGQRHSGNSAPRIDFAMDTMRVLPDDSRASLNLDMHRAPVRPATLSLTLERNPRMLINGNRVATYGPQLTAQDEDQGSENGGGGGETALYILGGVAALIGSGFLIAAIVEDDIADALGVDD